MSFFIPPKNQREKLIEPTPQNWGSNEAPGPAQQAGWIFVAKAAIMGYTNDILFQYRPDGHQLVSVSVPVYDEPTVRITSQLKSTGHEVRITPGVDEVTGIMAAGESVPGQQLSIVALARHHTEQQS